ncbi:hypothetical protein HYH03_015110 [Edaphochlamys debaryana]|uniref:Uncharacterized protein n=1 Tax=Edaphochlamys debaryana TaxID=47281 RepID=A0A836BR78_9CHLO|nr:hypothetical protein HYH03_015110 [Edaphochlamys debaryana]|eukprot:KAG2486146.1 hypothetical protein HYH03_015110 [Edaphochlamys debaryana]
MLLRSVTSLVRSGSLVVAATTPRRFPLIGRPASSGPFGRAPSQHLNRALGGRAGDGAAAPSPRDVSGPALPTPAPESQPPPEGRLLGLLRLHLPADGAAYVTGAATIRAAWPQQAALALQRGLASQAVALQAGPQAGGPALECTANLYYGVTRGEWRVTQLRPVAQGLGLEHGAVLEAWALPGGRVELRRPALAPPGAGVRGRRLGAVARAEEAALPVGPQAAGPAPMATGLLGRVSVGANRYLAGAAVLQAAFPAARSAALATGQSQAVSLLARSRGEGGEVLEYAVTLLGKTRLLSGVAALLGDLGAGPGDELELWRRMDGRIEARLVK